MRFRKRQRKKLLSKNLISEIYLQSKKKDASHKVRKSIIKIEVLQMHNIDKREINALRQEKNLSMEQSSFT